MRLGVQLLLGAGLLAGDLSAGTILSYDLSSVDATVQRYTYHISGITLSANQEIRILFAPTVFDVLSNGFAGQPGEFDLLLFQPDNPPQGSGAYSALALVGNPSLTGRFSVDFTLVGSEPPGSQIFEINQFDETGTSFVGQLETGSTVAAVPEPATLVFAALGLLLLGFGLAVRRPHGLTA